MTQEINKVLVTGAGGFLGQEVIKILKNKNFDFVGVSRNIEDEKFAFCDLSNPRNVFELLEKTKPDFIVNLAAHVDFKKRDLQSFFPVNVLLPTIFGYYCKDKDKLLIQSSGIIVHGFKHEIYKSTTELLPDSGYGESKLLADKIIMSSGCDYSILRIGGIFGRHGPTHLRINKAIDDAIKGKTPSVTGKGAAKRNYVYVRDVAKAIVKCIEQKITGVHYLGGEVKTIESMLIDLCEIFVPGNHPEYIHGENASDQIIENSEHFSITPFRTALKKMI